MSEPFFLVQKAPFAAITARVEGTDGAFGIAVYVALRCLANEARAADGPVQLSVGQVASRAGLSYNTAERILVLLRSIGVIAVEHRFVAGTKSRAPSVYSFPAIRETPSPALRETFPTETPPLRAEIKKDLKDLKEYAPADAAAPERAIKSPRTSQPRRRNPELDALAAVDGSDLAQVTGSAWGRHAKALAEIKAVCPDVSADEIRRRAERYRAMHPTWTITSSAIAKHWGSLGRATASDEPQLKIV